MRRGDGRPIIVVSLDQAEIDPATALVDAYNLAKRTLGLAQVAVVTGEQTFALSDWWGKTYSCFHEAVRFYYAGFDPSTQSPYAHPLTLRHLIQTWAEQHGEKFTDHLVKTAAGDSVRRLWSDQALPTVMTVRQAALRAQRERAQSSKVTSDTELLELEDEELRAKEDQINELKAALREKDNQTQQVVAEAEQVRRQQYWYQARLDQLEKDLVEVGRDLDAKVPILTDYKQMEDWAGSYVTGRVLLTPKAAMLRRMPTLRT